MIRRTSATLALVATLALAACGGATAPALTDPTAIVTAALASTEDATSVHIDVTADGNASVALPIPGGAGSGTSIALTGTTASVDIDFEDTALDATFEVPAILGLQGQLIVVDGKTYLKTSLTGAEYQVIELGDTLPIDPTDAGGFVDDLGDLLLGDGVELTKGGDVPCGSEQCYTVVATIDAEQLGVPAGVEAFALPVDLEGARLDLTIIVEKDLPHHLAGLEANVGLSDDDKVKIALTFSKWDESMTITAPPADQVKAGG